MQTRVPVDPAQPAAVAEGLQAYLDTLRELNGARVAGLPVANGAGFDTHIYFVRLEGEGDALPSGWQGELVLRIFPSPAQGERARRESEVQRFAAAAGYPAPPSLAWADRDAPLGLPFMIMPRVSGRMMLTLIIGRPWAMGRLLARPRRDE